MVSKTEDNKKKRRRKYLALGGVVAVCWLLTIFWGTEQVHQYSIQRNGTGLPERFVVFEDRQNLDESVDWLLITDPWATLPFVVSIEVDGKDGQYDYYHRRRFYYFWCLGYLPEWPFWGRYLPETYEM